MTRRSASSRSDPERRWRPRDRRGPVCGYTFDGKECRKRGAHYCEPRADRVVRFYVELLVHTKGAHARRVFRPADWQEFDIIRPVFGEVVWSAEWLRYVRRYRIVVIVLARKNGKSALLSGAALYLLVGDDEESAEVYGAAKDTKQAGKVFEPALRMMQLSPTLSKRLDHNKNARRLIDEQTASYYEIITSDAEGELGHNPHGFILDEVLSQPDDSLWNAMRTAGGTRTQPLLLCITTETNEPVSFGASMIDEADRIQEDPARAPHIFAYVRKLPANEVEMDRLRRLFPGHPDLPVSCDPFDERNWKWPNPGLDDFKTRASMREEKLEAENDPTKENSFRQFQVNQRVQQATRYVPLVLWDRCVGETIPSPAWLATKLEGKPCWAGLDLSAKSDLTAWCLLFEDGWCWWRLWCPEAMLPVLDKHTAGRFGIWARDGWVTLTEGDTIEYQRVYADIETDCGRFVVRGGAYDRWSTEPVRQEIQNRTGLELLESQTTYERMTAPMQEFMRLLKERELRQGGHPVLRWMADSLEARSPADDPDKLRPVKPDRLRVGKRIDGMVTLFLAIDARMRAPAPSIYETQSIFTIG